MSEKNIDVLLVNPPPVPNWDYSQKGMYPPPCGILSIATVLLKSGFTVEIIDGAREEDYLSLVEIIVRENNLLFFGISVMTSQLFGALNIARRARQLKPSLVMAWGGVHVSLFPEQTCMHELVDVCVIGEGEFTCLELAEKLRNNQDYSGIQGVFLKDKDGLLLKNRLREPLDLENLPFFDYSLIDVNKYILIDKSNIGGKKLKSGPLRRSLSILSGLGCPYSCNFCVESIMKRKYRRRSAESLISEIERLVDAYGINDVNFVEGSFFADKKRFLNFLDLLEEKKIDISWGANVRADYFREAYLNPDLLKRMRRLGCFNLGLGAESGSERILTKIDKRIEKKDTLRAAEWCRQADINIGFSFMIGLPDEVEEDMKATVRFAYQLYRINPDNSYIIGPNVFRPYPGSLLYTECVEHYGFKPPETLEGWSQVFSPQEGYFKLEDLPWIKKPKLVRLYCFYLNRATSNFIYSNLLVRFLSGLLKSLCRTRLKFNLFILPFEYYAIEGLKGMLSKKAA